MKNISVALALIIIIILVLAPFYILKESLNNKPSNQSIRVHWHTGNTTRLLEPISFQMTKILNSSENDSTKVVILSSNKDLLATLASVGLQSPIFFVEDQLTDKLKTEIKRLDPSGLKDYKNSQVLLVGNELKKY